MVGGPGQDMQNEALVNTDTGHSLNRHLTSVMATPAAHGRQTLLSPTSVNFQVPLDLQTA